MLQHIAAAALPFFFSLFAACAMTSAVCGVGMMLYGLRNTHRVMRHPYLDQLPWARYPASTKATILMDYFFRLAMPNSRFWVAAQANDLLHHVDPTTVPPRIRWPLIGFWGGCFIGLPAMLLMWLSAMLAR